MLRFRLFFGLLTLIILLWGVGAAALLLMRDSNKRFDKRLASDYMIVSTANGFRTITSTLNSTYIPLFTGPVQAAPDLPDRTVYDTYSAELSARLQILHESEMKEEALSRAVAAYKETYERILTNPPRDHEGKDRILFSISNQTQRITDLADSIAKMAETKLLSTGREAKETATQNYLFVSTLVLLGTAIAFIIYFQLMRHLVDPVSRLQLSIDEIRKGNFELNLPEPGQGSEFRSVVTAFNDMAAELKQRRSVMDDHLMRTNLVNRAILEAIPSPVFVLGDDTNIVQINPAAEELTEDLGVSGRLPLKIQRILDECRKTGTHLLPEDPREALLFRIHEEEFYYLPRIFRFVSEDDDKGGCGWAVLLHNVSRIRWLDDMKTNLLSTVSHEIKTPLTGIRMVLHLLLEESGKSLNAMQHKMVESANEDCERLLVTLNTLLDLSRAEGGTTQLSRVPVPMRETMERSVRLYHGAASAKGCLIEVEPPESTLPDALADPIRLDEVMNNLVSNAIKHSPPGGTITLRCAKQGAEFLRVSVIDRGPGVPEASQGRIFERFFRAPGQPHEGVGLGLFISREIMRAHEGRIGLMERAGNQTEFYLDVPIA
ncbi:MAG: HAMP domain-containing protein [Akkermansiaceae bacterium]|nr:HAMP domain-containing protein [Akkermansiaceae bacterium]